MRLLPFADDIVSLAKSPAEMQNTLDALNIDCNRNKLTVNTQKTNVIIFRKGGRNFKNLAFHLGNEKIKMVRNYAYLGISFSQSGLFCETTEQVSMKASIATKSTIAVINKSSVNSYDIIIKLFNALVNSVALYACEVWGPGHLDLLVGIQNKFFKKLLWLPKCTPHYAMRTELQVEATECKILKLTLNWIAKILLMEDDRIPKKALYALFELGVNKVYSHSKYNWIALIKEKFFAPISQTNFFNDVSAFNKLVDSITRKEIICKFEKFLIVEIKSVAVHPPPYSIILIV